MDILLFLAAKLIKLAIRPETLVALLIGLGLVALLRDRLRDARILLALALAAVLLIGLLPVGQLLLVPLERQYRAAPGLAGIDGIILLGGSEDVGPAQRWDRSLVNESGDRYLATIALAVRFPEARILVTGGGQGMRRSGRSEASVAEDLLVAAGIARKRLILETEARNTAENARLGWELVGQQATGRWVLVTSAFHMPRAVLSFCSAGWTKLVPWPTDYRTSGFWDDIRWDLAEHLGSLNAGIKEWAGLLGYRLSGRLESLEPENCLAADLLVQGTE